MNVNDLKTFDIRYPGGKTVGLGDGYGSLLGGVGFAGGKVVTIIDEFDSPMSYVHARVKGKESAGDITNSGGSVVLSFAKSGDVVVFSFVGYKTIEIPFDKIENGQKIRMEMSIEDLEPVVITAPTTTTTTAQLPDISLPTKKINWLKIAGISIAVMVALAIFSGSDKPRKVNV